MGAAAPSGAAHKALGHSADTMADGWPAKDNLDQAPHGCVCRMAFGTLVRDSRSRQTGYPSRVVTRCAHAGEHHTQTLVVAHARKVFRSGNGVLCPIRREGRVGKTPPFRS